MSDTYSDTSGRSDGYNAGAAHDTGFYDPDRHDNQIVAVYQDHAAAETAQRSLVDAGVPAAQLKIIAKVAGDAAPGASQVEDKAVGDQILSAFMSLFTSKDDHQDYTHAVDRGHAMLVVTPSGDTDRHRVVELLERSAPIDFDAKLAEWRQAGYDNSGAARAPAHDDTRRVGQREVPQTPQDRPEGQSRVRSYVANRDTTGAVTQPGSSDTSPQDGGMGTGGDVTNATPGAASSGMNAPRS